MVFATSCYAQILQGDDLGHDFCGQEVTAITHTKSMKMRHLSPLCFLLIVPIRCQNRIALKERQRGLVAFRFHRRGIVKNRLVWEPESNHRPFLALR